MRRGGAFMLHNNIGASETVEGSENAAEGGSRPSLADSGREGKKQIVNSFFSGFSLLPFSAFNLQFLSLHIFFSVLPATNSVFPCSLYSYALHPGLRLSLSFPLYLTYGYLKVSFSYHCVFYFPTLFVTAILLSLSPHCTLSISILSV